MLTWHQNLLHYKNRNVFSCKRPIEFLCFQAKAAVGDYKEAEEGFLLIQSEKIKHDYVYLSWLARCCKYYIQICGVIIDETDLLFA